MPFDASAAFVRDLAPVILNDQSRGPRNRTSERPRLGGRIEAVHVDDVGTRLDDGVPRSRVVDGEEITRAISRHRGVAAEPLHDRDRGRPGVEQRSAPPGERGVPIQQRIRIAEGLVKAEVDLNHLHRHS